MKISNKVKMIICFTLAVIEGMMAVMYLGSDNSQALMTNLALCVFLAYGGMQFKSRL